MSVFQCGCYNLLRALRRGTGRSHSSGGYRRPLVIEPGKPISSFLVPDFEST